MTDTERLPPLSPPLRVEAARLRSLEPSSGFQARLHAALLEADLEAGRATSAEQAHVRSEQAVRRYWPSSEWRRSVAKLAALSVPMLATAVLIAHEVIEDSVEPQQFTRSITIDVTLEEDGDSLIDLGLFSHHHNGSEATLHVEVPSDISVLATGHAAGNTEPRCAGEQCMYRFTQPQPHPDRVPVQLGIRAPGEYKIRVKHVSQVAHVQEDVLVRVSNGQGPDSGR